MVNDIRNQVFSLKDGQLNPAKTTKTKEYYAVFIYDNGVDCSKVLYHCPALYESFYDLGYDASMVKKLEDAMDNGGSVVFKKITVQE